MILYGIEIYAEKTEWTTNFIEAKKVVESAIRPIEDCGEVDEDEYVNLVKIDLEEFLVTKYDTETDLNDQLHEEVLLLKEYRWQINEEGMYVFRNVAK
ncbi:hypothetical protein MO163_001893 [Listeria monocytogenes]|nr:hypothetical protein [Listeria monocytogenes]EAE1846086.1 hypothetical protein [Listeria monocytogenes]EAF2835974.1 hypothetical protein [Listeria monocytogenes]EAF8400874.1 hypothetical protein [Listeria monocytogenes]EAG1414838.1 hypothetical protein [Listeria monocytogenes]